MEAKLHLALTALLVMVPGTISLNMGNTSIMWYLACGGCEAQEVTCPPTQKVLILQAEHAFKFLAACETSCNPACCQEQESDCLKPYSDRDVRDLQEACQDTHTCLVQDKEGTGPCGINNYYVYSRVNYMCVDGAADWALREKSVQGKTVYVQLAGRNRGSHQQRDENTTCIAESKSKENLRISFATNFLPPAAEVAVKVGEATHDLSQRNTSYSVTSPEIFTLPHLPGNAEVTVWAIIDGEGSEVSVRCTRHVIPVPQGDGLLVGAVVGGVTAAVVGLAVLILLAICIIRRWRSPNKRRRRSTVSEYAVVDVTNLPEQEVQLRRQPTYCEVDDDGQDYDKLGQFKQQQEQQNNNLRQSNAYEHIRPDSTAANGDSDYDHVIRGYDPGVITKE